MTERTIWRDGSAPQSNRREISGPPQNDPSPIAAAQFVIFHGRWPPSNLLRNWAGLVTCSPLIWIGAEHDRLVRWSVLARFTGEFSVKHAGRVRPTRPTRNDRRR